MGRSRSRSPRHRSDRDRRDRRRRSRSPRRRSRSPRRRHRSRSPGSSGRRPRSPSGRRQDERSRRDDPAWKTPHDAQALLTLGGSLGVKGTKKKKKKQPVKTTIIPINPEDITDEDRRMQELMGFGSFDTTKNKKVENNDTYAINRKVERKYRQYMNRKGGFNRPLEFMP